VWADVWRGNVRGALEEADDASRTAVRLDDRAASALALSAGALANAYAGNEQAARADAAGAMDLFAQTQWHSGAIWPAWALGFLELSLGHNTAVVEVLGPLSDTLGDLSSVDPVIAVFVPDEIEALVGLGQIDKAQLLLGHFERRAQALGRDWALAAAARCRGLVHSALGDADAALAVLEESLRRYKDLGLPFERARCLLELGRVQRRRKQKGLARATLLGASEIFASVGTPVWRSRAELELRSVSVRRASTGLTPTEENIAHLAVEGFSNRAIAQRCFVSVKTVEANLARAYRKLGITSRAQLARALDRRDMSDINS
jgi:DNA-binding CsgD family transcriptional regulator